jgi:hypothetical protein
VHAIQEWLVRESVGEEEHVKARSNARAHVTAALNRDVPAPVVEQPVVVHPSTTPIDLDRVESDEPLMNATGVPASFFPSIEYDEDGQPRPARLYDVTHRDDSPIETLDLEDVSDDRDDATYRPLA